MDTDKQPDRPKYLDLSYPPLRTYNVPAAIRGRLALVEEAQHEIARIFDDSSAPAKDRIHSFWLAFQIWYLYMHELMQVRACTLSGQSLIADVSWNDELTPHVLVAATFLSRYPEPSNHDYHSLRDQQWQQLSLHLLSLQRSRQTVLLLSSVTYWTASSDAATTALTAESSPTTSSTSPSSANSCPRSTSPVLSCLLCAYSPVLFQRGSLPPDTVDTGVSTDGPAPTTSE